MQYLHNFRCIARGIIDAILFDPVEDFLSSLLKTKRSGSGDARSSSGRYHAFAGASAVARGRAARASHHCRIGLNWRGIS
jgi:hypothetical protein